VSENGTGVETISLTIDGRDVTVPKGTMILEAANGAGTDVPHYCYHPGLSSPAMCRLCLVDVEGANKPMPSCVTQVAEGQVVHTESGEAADQRKGVLEFYLLNHPLDCPICDQSGECKLQDYVNAEGRTHGRNREPKRVFGRDDFGGDILFYGDRCVMCTRCVRFMTEVAQDPKLCVVERGNRAVIDTFFEEGLAGSPYAGNIVDICPVGALVSKDFLHKARAWDLDHTPSVCSSCSQGCNTELHTRDDAVQRIKPRENADVNAWWMCDFGRNNYEWMNRPDRIERPQVRASDGSLRDTSWTEALGALVDRLRSHAGTVRVLTTGSEATEDYGALRALLDHMGGGPAEYRSARTQGQAPLPGFPGLVRREDLASNRRGAAAFDFQRIGDDEGRGGLGDAGADDGLLIVMGDELADMPKEFGGHAGLFVYLGRHTTDAQVNADFVLPITNCAEQEGTFVNTAGRIQRFWPALRAPGSARPAWMVLGAILAELHDATAPQSAAASFAGIADAVGTFAGLSYESIGTRGAILNEPVELKV